ncbi:prohibitin family protein [Terrisporobacter sp.]|uniref:prohibitin family protein n=1 Tax=Terrisporobacter sp. TaxID=1965305 RepID=UPI0039918467
MKLRYLAIPIVIAGVLTTPFCTTIVPAGHVGAVYDKLEKGVQNYTLSEGFHFKAPWQKIKSFPVSIETVYMSADDREGSEGDESVTVSCSDGSLNADLTFSYRFDAEDVPAVQKKYRGKDGKYIMNSVLRGQLRTWVSEVTKNYTTMEVHLTNTAEVNSKLTEYLNKKALKYGVTFENVSLAETRASNDVQRAIEKRQQIAQELEQQKLSLEKAEVEKKEEQLKQEKAFIQAEGERKANEEKAKGLSDKILKQMMIEKWDGSLPKVTDGNTMINLD